MSDEDPGCPPWPKSNKTVTEALIGLVRVLGVCDRIEIKKDILTHTLYVNVYREHQVDGFGHPIHEMTEERLAADLTRLMGKLLSDRTAG